MRITNKVMQNNSVRNINRNKGLQDTLSTQIATGKKISRPSEDPVVAIRALRLRSDVNQVNQYYEKNAPDAKQWMKLTESSISTTISVIKSMIEECEKGASDTLQTADRKTIINSLKALGEEVYSTGDADYAGRYIFTGYRTDTSLSFQTNTTQKFSITELFNKNDLEQMTYIETAGLTSLSETNFDAGALTKEQDITYGNYYRYRLSYDNLDTAQVAGATITVNGTDYPITAVDESTMTANEVYEASAGNPTGVYLIPSTGELVLGEDVYAAMMAQDTTTNFQISYDKSTWVTGDLRPQHYFYAETQDPDTGLDIVYNPDYLTKKSTAQAIEYQVGFNQNIQVNSYAEEVFQHGVGRDVDEIVDLAGKLEEAEAIQAKLQAMSEDTKNYTDAQREDIAIDLDAANKAVTLLRDDLQKRFSSYITKMQKYLNADNNALTEVGNRSSRLELISNRLCEQNTTFETLQSDNEDADITEVAVHLSSAKVNYEAALMATSDLIQTTLLNYL